MNVIPRTAPASNQPLSRDMLLTLIETALRANELRYARRLCTAWLAIYPGDLEVNLLFARAYAREKSVELQLHAVPILEELCKQDPEFVEAQDLLAELTRISGDEAHVMAKACVNALRGGNAISSGKGDQTSAWEKNLYQARTALSAVRSGDYQQIEKAEHFIHKALVDNPETPLTAVVHLRLVESKGSMPKLAVRSLAQIYHERWPDCLQFMLSLSNELMESGETNLAVSLLHQAVSKDITGQVSKRMWGSNHQYLSLWPAHLEAIDTGQNSPQSIPVPAAVASILGWNQIGAGFPESPARQPASRPSVQEKIDLGRGSVSSSRYTYLPHSYSNNPIIPLSESAQNVQTELERMADELKRPQVVREDGRFPRYIIFSTRGGMEAQYGTASFQTINVELKRLASLTQGVKINKEFWGSLLFYADDPASTQPFNLQPAQHDDPWALKSILNQLDAALEKRGERIGALLIVGGPEIVPFHNLPNPVEDADTVVPSDNPYATRDSNYFISDWPVGRISGGSEANPGALITILKEITNRYDPRALRYTWYYRLKGYLQELVQRGVSKKQSSFGYTAAVWQRASQSVYRSIGEPSELIISPPTHTCDDETAHPAQTVPSAGKANTCLLLPQSRLGYFNLHGVPDGCEWYGQVDPAEPVAGPDFPVAMRPQDIHNSGSAPRLVFSEACYGANIIDKTVDDAISLKFISSGTHAVIGSTCISYGSLSAPLTAADLLGRVFWSLLQEGFTAGEALRRAKIHLTREMHRRQGFLDAEDQKTLISFVLFGDPLAQPFHTKNNPKVTPHLSDSAVPVPTVCEQSCDDEAETPVSLETISHLKSVVEQYLPSMADAKVSLSREKQSCSYFCNHYWTGKKCVHPQPYNKNADTSKFHRRVVTLSKNIEQAQHIHRQYARVTLDERGKIIKMVVSH